MNTLAVRHFGRRIVVLPADHGKGGRIAWIHYRYRVEKDFILPYSVEVAEAVDGEVRLSYTLLEGWPLRSQPFLKFEAEITDSLKKPLSISVDLRRREAFLDGICIPVQINRPFWSTRRLAAEFRLMVNDHICHKRLVGHYLSSPFATGEVDYFHGGTYEDYETEISIGLMNNLLDIVQGYVPEGRFLDVGCATGRTLDLAQRRGFECYGVDISPEAIAASSRYIPISHLATIDINRDRLPFDGGFDVIFMKSILEHTESPEQIVKNLSAHLRRGGILLIWTSNGDSLSKRIWGEDWEGYFDPTHCSVNTITVKSLQQMLEEAGMSTLMIETCEIWTKNPDPYFQLFRRLYHSIPEFKRMVNKSQLGDFIKCVAQKA